MPIPVPHLLAATPGALAAPARGATRAAGIPWSARGARAPVVPAALLAILLAGHALATPPGPAPDTTAATPPGAATDPATAHTAAASPVATVTSVRIHLVASPADRALEADPVARALAAGTWTPPAAADTSWHRALADSAGWITDPRLTRGYALGTVTVPADTTLLLEAWGFRRVWMRGHWREGNLYGGTEETPPWQPDFDFVQLPVRLPAGETTLLFHGNRFGRLRARFWPPPAPLSLNLRDATVPDLVVGRPTDALAAVVVVNATGAVVTDATLTATVPGGAPVTTAVPPVAPWSVRKVGLRLRGPAPPAAGEVIARLALRRGDGPPHTGELPLAVKDPGANRRVTFTSALDGSVQEFGWQPAADPPAAPALILSLHGANVDALNQSGAYPPLGWAHVVAPTNRRPYGFNWEDWGRRDALEVLDLVQRRLATAPDRVYLTGHSMGGHGTWHLGTLHPDRFAAIAPSAGWLSFWSYRPDRERAAGSSLAGMLARATLPSRTRQNARNLADLGVYVLHGADDRVVPVTEARAMRDHLAGFHRDLDFHEEPGAGHWWDRGDGPGADCVAWPPLLDFLARHRRPAPREVRHVRFRTPAPAVSHRHRWVRIARQHRAFLASTVDLRLDPAGGTLAGTTENVARLGLDLAHVQTDSVQLAVDGDTLAVVVPRTGPTAASGALLWLARPAPDASWRPAGPADPARKGPHRGSGLRTVLDRRVQLVYATGGTAAENAWARTRARQDAEHLWYQGNASLDVLPDTLFAPADAPDRNVILYGNADTHAHWDALWPAADVQLGRTGLRIGDRELAGPGLGLLAVRPRPGSPAASVAVIGGTGLPGCRLTDRRPYLAPGVAYPDVTVLQDRHDAAGTVVRAAGFLGPAWTVAGGELVWDDRAIGTAGTDGDDP